MHFLTRVRHPVFGYGFTKKLQKSRRCQQAGYGLRADQTTAIGLLMYYVMACQKWTKVNNYNSGLAACLLSDVLTAE